MRSLVVGVLFLALTLSMFMCVKVTATDVPEGQGVETAGRPSIPRSTVEASESAQVGIDSLDDVDTSARRRPYLGEDKEVRLVIEVVDQAGSIVSGVVVDLTSDVIPNGRVTRTSDASGHVVETLTLRSGAVVRASSIDDTYLSNRIEAKLDPDVPEVKRTLVVRRTSWTIDGTVRNPERAGIVGARVLVIPPIQGIANTSTEIGGEFVVTIPNAVRQVTLAIVADGYGVVRKDFASSPSGNRVAVDIILERGLEVTVRVVDELGLAIENCKVALASSCCVIGSAKDLRVEHRRLPRTLPD